VCHRVVEVPIIHQKTAPCTKNLKIFFCCICAN